MEKLEIVKNKKNNLYMKIITKIAFTVTFAAIAGYGVYTNQKSHTALQWYLADIEAIAGCETSSNGSENKGYCSPNYGGSGDSCTTTGDSGAVRCSGNY